MAQPNRQLAVSCYFGNAPHALHPAPKQVDAVFIANDAALEDEASRKGWSFRLATQERFPVLDDVRLSSIQSKYVKFFQFLDDFPDLQRFQYITYYDHKVGMADSHLLWLHTRLDPTKRMIVRSSPKRKGVRQEIAVAKNQPRYAETMPQTIAWVDKICAAGFINESAQIANTGIIHCTDIGLFRPMFDEIYKTITAQQQPECQIIWHILSQRYAHHIQQVSWFDLDVPWVVPK